MILTSLTSDNDVLLLAMVDILINLLVDAPGLISKNLSFIVDRLLFFSDHRNSFNMVCHFRQDIMTFETF